MPDVTIRGAGVFGLSIAWTCVQRGAKVRLVDPNGVASGASGGIVGALAPHVPENWNEKKQFQLESLLMSQNFWKGVKEASGQDPGYARTGRLQPLPDARSIELAQERSKGANIFWRGQASWKLTESSQDWSMTSPTGQFVLDTLSARIHPRRACLALEAALKTKGVVVELDAPFTAKTIWATGIAGFAEVKHKRPVGSGVKGQAALLGFKALERPQVFSEALHFIPHSDGTVAIGSTSENQFDHPNSTDEALENLIERTRQLLPELSDAPVLERWAGVRPRARSRAPMLGPLPDRQDHFVANGGFKIGFGMAPKVAQVMANLVLEDRNEIPQSFLVEASF